MSKFIYAEILDRAARRQHRQFRRTLFLRRYRALIAALLPIIVLITVAAACALARVR